MKPDECDARAREIEQRANALADQTRKSFRIYYPSHRSARYSGGIGDVIREMAVSGAIKEIEAGMHAEMESLYEEFYAPENYEDRNS